LTLQPDTQQKQREFRKELGLRNLVTSQILNIVGLFWVGVAARLGPSHVIFWLLGIVLFYLPSAAVVIYLNRVHTLEGGLYEWARLGFNDFAGFLVAWNMWLNMVAILSYAGLQTTAMYSYFLGPQAAWMAASKWVNLGITLGLMAVLIVVAAIGLGVAKWIQDLGGILMVAVFVALIALPFRNHVIGRPTEYPPFTLSLPAISVLSLNLLGKMSFGAMSGFDSVAILAGECRNAAKTIGRSVLIATPIIAAMFVLGTSSVVALVPKDKIDLISPISQALTLGTRPSDPGARLIPLAIAALLFSFIAASVLTFVFTTRLPLVAGWDNLLPAWFGRVHPRRKTPTNAILFVGAIACAMAVVGVAGSGQQEAFQLLQNSAGIFYALAYLAMFALPLVGRQRNISKPAWWLKGAAISGFLMTAMYLVLSLFPIIDVAKPWLFTAKVGGFIFGCQLMAVALFCFNRRKNKAGQQEAAVAAESISPLLN
jgi:glutamate:GABA antiporter